MTVNLRNLPRLADVRQFRPSASSSSAFSTTIERGKGPGDFGRVMTLKAGRITSTEAPYDIVREDAGVNSGFGPACCRAGRRMPGNRCPGGCAIGQPAPIEPAS